MVTNPPSLSGATRLHVIIGDPIVQVKAPGGMTEAFHRRGYDGILVPVQVAVADLAGFLRCADTLRNLDGIVVTVPHKFSCFPHCREVSSRARFIGAVNIMRRQPEGGWYGDSVDGLGLVGAVKNRGGDPAGKRALLLGAGGAGSAIAHALVEAGVRDLAIHDENTARRDALISRLSTLGKAKVMIGSADPSGFDLVVNATPSGMRSGDPLPIDVTRLASATFVGCVITQPEVSPLIVAARARGCSTSTGTDMYQALQSAMLDFLVPARS